MIRLIAALLVVAGAFAFSAAQEAPEPKPLPRLQLGGSKSQIPFDVVEVDGKTAWRVAGRGTVRVDELIAGYASATGKLVIYDGSATSAIRQVVPYVGPDDGIIVPNAELGNYVSELLEGAQCTLIGLNAGKVRVIGTEIAPSFARLVEVDELVSLPDSEWVTLIRVGLQVEPETYGRALRMFSSRSVQISVVDDMLITVGQVAQLRNVLQVISKVESSGSGSYGMQVRVYEMPPNHKATDAARVINELFEEPTTKVQKLDGNYTVTTSNRRNVSVSISPTGSRLLVRARVADHLLVKAAIDGMQ